MIKSWKPTLTIVYKDGSCIGACLARIFIRYKLAVSERNTTQKLNLMERAKFFIFRFADFIIPNSYTQTKYISNKFPKLSTKVRTITNMIDIERFYPSEIYPNFNRVLITARLTPQKNVLNFLKALNIANLNSKIVHFDWFGKIHNDDYYR